MSGYSNGPTPGGNDPWRQHSSYGPSYGQYGQPGTPFGTPPSSGGVNLKVPLIIAGIFSCLIFMLIAGLFVFGAVRRGMREFEIAQAQAQARADFERMEAERKERQRQQQIEFENRMNEIRTQDQERMARMRAEQQARMDSMRSATNFVPPAAPSFTPPPAFAPPPSFTPAPAFTPPSPNRPPAFTPPSFQPVPPSFTPPTPANEGAPKQQQEAPPGFPATDMSQFKAKDIVFVSSQDKWYPALVQVKRGKLTQVRYTTNGVVEVVTIDRIRLEKEPDTKDSDDLPTALRPAGSGPFSKSAGTTSSSDSPDDDLTVAASNKKPASEPVATSPVPTSTPTNTRQWTDATGKFKIEAELIGFEFDHVQLKRTDGKIINMALAKLSEDDQKFVKDKYP